ncbi:uncharacterized protein LOC128219111 [Mya arenaria]|nr:uncharacterized protein LOC128219111 [Mya arenaria]
MALIGLLATRKATENLDLIQITGVVKYMIVCNFLLSLLCSVLAAVSSFYSFLVVEQCSHINSKYYELCLPNSRTNIGLSVVDGVVCLFLFMLSVLGISHFSQYGSKLCFNTDEEVPVRKVVPLALVLPGQSYGQG